MFDTLYGEQYPISIRCKNSVFLLLQQNGVDKDIGKLSKFIYMIIMYIIQSSLSSSSYRAGSTDIPDPLSPLLPIVHRPR